VARILICEPHDDISALLELVVRRLGHEPVMLGAGEAPSGIDAAVIEPAGSDGMRRARELSERDVPVLFASIYPPDANALAVRPFAYLVKPFPLYALERALVQALTVAVPAATVSTPS
jgi:CheY-like chemotaxis protein